jgi:aminoglycoside phosphotransferase (APT) family kinase protein
MASHLDTSGRSTPGSEAACLREAARAFFPEECTVAILGVSSGYSGSAFARIEALGRSWCLRGWPLRFEEKRLRFIHRALLEIRSGGFQGVPNLASTTAGETVAEVSGRLYDAQEWMAGSPLPTASGWTGEPMPNLVVRSSPRRLRALTQALARLHCAGVRLAGRPEQKPDHLSRRLDALADEFERHVGPWVRAVLAGNAAENGEVASRWLELLSGALPAAREASEGLPDEDRGTMVVCHGDLWSAHVWFDGEAFVGFTDFESLTFASPALDLAQLVTHFASWESRHDVLKAYEDIAQLQERDLAALPIEAVADLAGEGLWSLSSLYGEALPSASPAQEAGHRTNLRGLLVSLEQAIGDVKRSRL